MSEPTGPVCPRCGTPRATDGTPACSCGQLASDAHRENRTAQAAAAEDFDPVRIRPFVKVSGEAEAADGGEDADEAGHAGPGDGTGFADGSAAAPLDTGHVSAGEPVVSSRDADDAGDRSGADGGAQGARRRRRRGVALAAGAGAVVVAAVAAGFISGLFSYEAPSRDGALPDDVRAELPEGTPSGSDAPSTTPSRATSSPTPSDTPATSPSGTPSESRATPTGSSSDPTGIPSGGGQTATAGPIPTQSVDPNPVLRFGDTGPEVTELQLRLRESGLYDGDIDGDYDRQVESAVRAYQLTRVILDDESGVYGVSTRASLESETSEP
ncbi:peptidoglycan-binding domain-containing protein [Streptomyces ipomoeae]|uniref:peptidoglycan-binding domain-containing protein n=1 Tax=Streptomyces ipomoeae TaxID=103232 RepID=UPI0011466548|nr:peptidoglycan-binding domain-containing protein [Streptomyces ipomoeae]MDX2933682.1 peptidoglycan-binding protein [Streptomyces ipomoeae]TQE25892.1 peptidoglycan-binding protein [Streptomyces ipomoeae]